MAIGDRMQDMMSRRDARVAERDARRAEMMANRLSRMADRPMRTPELQPRTAPIAPTVGVSSRRLAENARREAIGMPLLPDPTMPAMPSNRTVGEMLGSGIGALTLGPRPALPPSPAMPSNRTVGEMLGGGIDALSLGSRPALPPSMPQAAMPQPDQSYGSWLSSQIRSGVDFGNVDPRAVYNQGSNRPLPNVAPAAPMMPQAPTPFGGKGGQPVGQMLTQPSGKGAANPAMGAGLSALGLFR